MRAWKVGRAAKVRQGWLAVVAVAGSLLGCSPAHDRGPDAMTAPGEDEHGKAGHGGNGGATAEVDGGAAGAPACPDGGAAPEAGPTGAAPDAGAAGAPVCKNACAAGATRCASATSVDVCTAGPDGCTSFVASACESGAVCERGTPAGCLDPEWAEWPMPNGAGDIALGAPNLQTLVDNLDGTVTDKVTGLMWEQDFHHTLFGGRSFCQGLTTAGHSDWRQPTIIELISIADFTKDDPSFDTTLFPLDALGPFWSATVRDGFGASLDIIDYYVPSIGSSGGVGTDGPLGSSVRCVR